MPTLSFQTMKIHAVIYILHINYLAKYGLVWRHDKSEMGDRSGILSFVFVSMF